MNFLPLSSLRRSGAIALAIALPLAAGVLAGCGGSGSAESSGADTAGSTAPAREAAAASFTMASQFNVTLSVSSYSSGDWETGASPANLKGLAVPEDQPVGVPLASKGGKNATYLLSTMGQTSKVLMQGSTCVGFTGSWYSGYSPARGWGNGARIACAGQGISITAQDQF